MSTNKNEPPEIAVALHYDGENAPTITAKGQGELASQIIELAEQHDVPLQDDPELAAMLAQMPLGEQIPEPLYRAVAEVIAFAYMVSGKRPPGYESG